MHITWAGLACFKIEEEGVAVMTDPFGSESGLKLGRPKADLVLSSCRDDIHGYTDGVSHPTGRPKIIQGAGEYEVKDVLVYGTEAAGSGKKSGPSIFFRFQMDGMTLVHLGALQQPLSDADLQHLEKTDILFVPAGGGRYLKIEDAVALVHQIEPRIIIPMLYKIPGVKANLGGLNDFIKELGIKPEAELAKLKIAKKDLPADVSRVFVLTPQ